jgi:hypothetical protein
MAEFLHSHITAFNVECGFNIRSRSSHICISTFHMQNKEYKRSCFSFFPWSSSQILSSSHLVHSVGPSFHVILLLCTFPWLCIPHVECGSGLVSLSLSPHHHIPRSLYHCLKLLFFFITLDMGVPCLIHECSYNPLSM